MIVAVDVGYGRTKFATEGKVDFFSSYLSFFRDYYTIDFMRSVDVIEVDGISFYVGDKALAVGDQISLIGNDFHGSREWKALLSYAFYQMKDNISNNVIDRLAIGLPLSQFTDKRKAQIRSIKSFRCKINGEDFEFEVDKIIVLPQGAGAILEYSDSEEEIGIVDIGYYTLDFAYFKDGEINPKYSSSENSGIFKLYQYVANLLKKKFDISCDTKAIEKIINKKKIFVEGKEHDLSDDIDNLKYDYCSELVYYIKQHWGTVLKGIQKIMFIGGGSEVIKTFLPEKSNYVIPKNPAFANVLGYYKYAKQFGE